MRHDDNVCVGDATSRRFFRTKKYEIERASFGLVCGFNLLRNQMKVHEKTMLVCRNFGIALLMTMPKIFGWFQLA